MSFMKRLVTKAGGAQSQTDSTPKQQDNALGLMHLRKLFAEFRHPSANATQKDQEDKLYNMLPLFCKIFGHVPASSMSEKFSDILQFCSHVSKLMVTEVRRRASNQSTEEASCAIVKFLEIESTEESSAGWMLLSTINLLSMGNQALIDCMTAASLPSTLVKCLYLFFDLPELSNPDNLEPGCEFSPKERRVLLQKVFVQVLVRLCNHLSPAEELARKDDLSLLFSAITSWCPIHNIVWRKSAGEVLVTLSRHGLNPSVTKYIHDKGCVRHCVENMQRAQDLSPLDLVEMFVTVFCFLKDSSEVSHVLLDDFRSCQGYTYLSEFILRLELDTTEESIQALRNLVLLVGSLTTCGYNEMKPNTASTGSLYQIPGFSLPQPAGKGVSVRNIQAFQVLQNVFLKAQSSNLCNTILDVMSSIYHQDNANYFILEPQHTLSQFAEKIHFKSPDVQEKFFELLEFIVFNLNFVPCKELISLSLLLKTQHSVPTSILCIKTLQRILQFNNVFKDVYREVGMLEVLVTCLHRFAALLKDPQADGDTTRMTKEQRDLGFQVMEVLSSLLGNSNQNSSVFRECGGARCAHNMVPYVECRTFALGIVQQLVLSPGGDDDMGTLLGLMHTAEITNLELKTSILKSLLNVLRESHRTRTVFRKVGGFVYVMSVLVSMEGCLADPPKSPWDKVSRQEILMMLKTVFSTLTVAMRYEPANAKFFATDVRYDSLTEAVRLLGCFSNGLDIDPVDDTVSTSSDSYSLFEDFFQHGKEARVKDAVPILLVSACQMVKYLYDMALDAFDRPYLLTSQKKSDSPSTKRYTMSHENSISPQSSPRPKRASTGSLTLPLGGQQPEHIIHAGAIMSIFYLLPALFSDKQGLTLSLQVFVAGLLKSLLKKEHNQQVMCDASFPHDLLSHGNIALADESSPLHPSLQYMFERLASQSLTPRDLRDFLRLGSPLNCKPADEDIEYSANQNKSWPLSRHSSVEEKRTPYEVEKKLKTTGYPVPLTRVKCLVSMTTPKDARMHGSSVTPAFVEFNMNAEGFGCLYLPSIAPQGPPTPSVVSGVVGASDPSVIGGIGSGERVFPPQSGLTFSTWFCVDKFSQMGVDPHPVRLFTIVRNLQGREENLICLSIILSAKDKALYVCTQETLMPNAAPADDIATTAKLNDNTAKFLHGDFEQEGQWHHLILIFHRAGIMKNSSVSLFLDGDHIHTQKLHYISPNLGVGGSASPTAFTSVFGYIGTPPQLRRQSRLTWRQGPCHLMEDVVSSATVKNIYTLGPTYIGSFQAPYLEDKDMLGSFIAEDKLVFGVHAHAMSQLTIAKMRKIYNKVDSKSIAKQLAMSSHDNATPIRILHNSVGHLGGYARCLGAILMGYLGVRTFCPMPVAKMLQNVGGTCTLLGLVAMATDVEGLYAAVKALVCVVKSNKQALHDLDRIRGYQILAMLYKKKQQLLNSHILHLTFSLVGTVDSGKESSIIPNKKAFEDILCDLEVWHEAPGDLQRSLYEHFYELLTDSSDQVNNLRLMREIGLSSRLLQVMRDPRLPQSTIETMANVIGLLMEGNTDQQALLKLGQFLVATIPESHINEKTLVVENCGNYIIVETEEQGCASIHKVRLRNTLLRVMSKLIHQSPHTPTHLYSFSDEVQKVLGFDWLLMFTQCHLHPTTVIQALRILMAIFRNPHAVVKFREGQFGGGWLKDTDLILKQQIGGSMLGFNLHSGHHHEVRELNQEICHVPGFTVLQWLLPKHNNVPELYILLMAMLLGQQVNYIPADVQLSLDAVWTLLFGVPVSKPGPAITRDKDIQLCPDAAIILLTMIRSMLNPSPDQETDSLIQEYPITLLQFLLFLYHNHSDFIQLSVQPDFISALAATLFPYFSIDSEECVTTPEEEFKPFPESESMVYVRSPDRDKTSFLSGHSARKFVVEFMRTIVIDSLSHPTDAKSAHVLDLMLEASPEHATRAQQREYQTEMLKILMEHLLAADVLLGDQAALPIMSGGNYTNMANNVFYFTARVVDKMWQGAFTREAKEVFEFISKLISQAKRKSSGVNLESIYKSLNRTILFQLSRPVDSVPGQTQVLDALHKLTNNRNLVFGPGNYDQEFLGCLCYCLLNLTEDTANSATNLQEEQPIRTRWHLNLDTQITGDVPYHGPGLMEGKGRAEIEGLHLVSAAAKRVWEEAYLCKKPTLEEMFRTQLNNIDLASSSNLKAPDLASVRHLIQEQASRFWVTYAENERKGSYTSPEKLPPQIKTIQMVGSRMLSFATRKAKKELPLKSSPSTTYHPHDYIMWTLDHMLLVKDLVEHQHRMFVQNQEHMERYLMDEWAQIEYELLRERGLWGPIIGSRLDKWQLDMTEGPFRMRKKMVKNDLFYVHYPYRPDMESSPLKYKIPISLDSKEYYLQYRSQTLFGEDVAPIKHGMEELPSIEADVEDRSPEDIMKIPKLLPRKLTKPGTENNDDDDDGEGEKSDITETTESNEPQSENLTQETGQRKADNQAILRMIGDGEKISHMFRCARIQGLDTAEGLLLFGKEHFHIIDGFTLLATKEIKDIDTLPAELHDPIIPRTTRTHGVTKKMYSKFAYEDVREVHKRRYLLQPIAIEVFSSDGRNYLLAFPKKVRNKVYQKFMSVATAITDNAQQSVSGQRQNARIEAGSGLISSLMGEKSVTQRWERGEINNFQYLMHLNTLAGRSYNDLMQYPVFPWILADYESEDLDLCMSETFRDLSRPMGAQTPDRLKHFMKRYHDWDDPQGETPPYHYGTHYSSAMIVASYLVRMEPFTQTFLNLQGGHFDLADRMFHSIKENWLSASKNNMADVKELIPEFFYLPEFLVNSNNFDLGCKQSGVQLHDVVLPPWARGDPREFIRGHREALECDYVSAHLHEWIDLIFGNKQQGQGAVDSVNVFHHLFYEGNVDIYSIEDPLKKNATIGFINNFGQIPKQIFRKSHPQKRLNIRAGMEMPVMSGDRLFFHNVDNLKPCMQPVKELKGAVGQIMHNDRYVLAVEQNKVLIPSAYNKYLAWGFSDLSVRIGNYESEKATSVFEGLDNGEILCAACPNVKVFITGGTSCVVNVWEQSAKDKRVILKQPLYGHTEPVTCVAVSPAYNIIVSGSRDRSCIIWDLSRLVFVRQLRGHIAPVAAVCINELTGDIASCAGTYLHLWSINGDEIACVNTASVRNHQILCVAMSQVMEWDNRNVIMTGSSDGVVRMWSVEYVQVPDELKLVVPTKPAGKTGDSTDATDSTGDKSAESSQNGKTDLPRSRPRSTSSYSEDVQSAAVDRLKDFKDPDNMTSKLVDLGSSVDSNSHFMSTVREKLEGLTGASLDTESAIEPEEHTGNLSTTSSMSDLYNPEELVGEECGQDTDGQSLQSGTTVSLDTAVEAIEQDMETGPSSLPVQSEAHTDQLGDIGRSASQPEMKADQGKDTSRSLSSEFEVITDTEVKNTATAEDIVRKYRRRTKNTLREGFRWQRQLVFRSKLTMHTAFERKDNKDPAAVTAVAISRDHKTVYVGDAKGRIFSWTVTDQPGRVVADHWMKDDGVESCLQCGIRFSFSERRHHCRNCGRVFCSKCSRYETEIRRLRIIRPVRVCQACYNILRTTHAVDSIRK